MKLSVRVMVATIDIMNILGFYRVLFLLISASLPAGAIGGELLQRASCRMGRVSTRQEVLCFADVIAGDRGGPAELRVYAEGQAADLVFHREIKLNKEFVLSVGSVYVSNLGRVIYVEWQWGAKALGMTLYKLSPEGAMKEIFRDGGVDGVRLAEVGGEELKLVVLDRDDGSGDNVARVYGALATGEIKLVSTIRSSRPLLFEIKSEPKLMPAR